MHEDCEDNESNIAHAKLKWARMPIMLLQLKSIEKKVPFEPAERR